MFNVLDYTDYAYTNQTLDENKKHYRINEMKKKFPSIRKKYYVIKFILIFHVF